MINIIELEKRWLNYKIKSYIPHITILASLIIIFSAGIVFYNTNDTDSEVKPTPVLSKKAEPIKKVIVAIKTKEKVLKLQPSLNFERHLESSPTRYVPTPQVKHKKVVKVQTVQKPKPVYVAPPKVEKVSKINIKREDTQRDFQDIINRFKKHNNPTLSLFIAKKYYDKKNYQQAYNYALITNKLDSSIDESWIVFCKSLVKLGKKKFAIKILEGYIQNNPSTKASVLLSNIKAGHFR